MLKIEYVKTSELIPYARNSRTHSTEQVQQIAASIKEFGFTNPVLIDDNNGIIAGHGRLMAAQLLKMDTVPCIVLTGLTETQRKAYIIADNKIALNSGWDEDLLKLELIELDEMGFDYSELGFDFEFEDINDSQEPFKNERTYDGMLNNGKAIIIGDFEHLYSGDFPKIQIPQDFKDSAVEQVLQVLKRITNECKSRRD